MKSLKFAFWVFFALAITSCDSDSTSKDPKPKDVTINLEMTVGEESMVIENTYKVNNVDVLFSNVAFYLGDMTFKTSNGSTFTDNVTRYQLIRPGIVDYSFSISADEDNLDTNLDEISFILGVDATTNAEVEIDFTMREPGDPLGQQSPTMHWGWQGGYRFMNIDALADLDGDGMFETQLTYHLGKADFLGNIKLTPNQELEDGDNNFKINVDIAQMLNGVDFNTEQFTKAQPDNISIAQKVFANYDSSFTFEK